MDRVSVAKGVAERLFDAEDSIDGSLRQASRLMTTLVDSRRDLRLAAVVGEDVVQRTASAINALATAREEIVRAHAALAATRDRLGLRTVALGSLEKPDDPSTTLPSAQNEAPTTEAHDR